MCKQHSVYSLASRALIAASFLAVAYATASAQGTVGPPPVISPDEVGYVFVRFMLNRVLPDAMH